MILHLVGNRPQFIKLAPLYRALQARNYEQCIIHSGQHYDESLSDVFFKELNIPQPYVNLKVGSGSHAEITAGVMLGFEKQLVQIQPEFLILYGDTDTTLAGAVTAAKLNIPIAHVEGGTRTHYRGNPEEYNRIVADHLSDLLFCPDQISLENACSEGLDKKAFLTGDIMYDMFLAADAGQSMDKKNDSGNMILLTWHRQENTGDKDRMLSILKFIDRLEGEIVCPMHPRTRKQLKYFNLWDAALGIDNFRIVEPVGYLEMVALMNKARLIVTDSGGVSKESSFAGAKCVFMLEADIWDDLVKANWILKMNPEDGPSVEKALKFGKNAVRIPKEERPCFYGDGHAADKMVDLMEEYILKQQGD